MRHPGSQNGTTPHQPAQIPGIAVSYPNLYPTRQSSGIQMSYLLVAAAKSSSQAESDTTHFADAGTARQVTAAFARALAPGSYLVISVGSGNPDEGDNFTSAYTAAQINIHPVDDIVSFFAGLDLVPPGVVPVSCWNGDGAPLDRWPRTATFLGGVARNPETAAPGAPPN
jgi:S-adenosyl methyltransferase